jgi:2-oxopent-4-enoate/cis-2-oxohex-4-enoate hydratase
LNASQVQALGLELHQARVDKRPLAPFTDRVDGISIDDAYAISLHALDLRLQAGEKIVGKKIGATSRAVQSRFGVDQPDFGYLTDKMLYGSGEAVPIDELLIQPMVEGELGFVLKRDLQGPGVTATDVLLATECVMACIEIVDSRIMDWKIKIQDTVADNASSGLVVISDQVADPRSLDLYTVGMVQEKNGAILSTGAGAAVLGSPTRCVAWLANAMGRYGHSLKAGELILSGSFVAVEPVRKGDFVSVRIGGVGSVSARFT